MKVSALIKFLVNRPDSYEFLRPVDYKGLGLLDYPVIIKKPMDLSTVKKNLKNAVYSTTDQALADLMLIWENCKLYNPAELLVHQQAVKMEEHMLEYLAEHAWDVPLKRSRADARAPLTYQRKLDLIEGLCALPEDELGKVVDTLLKQCPRAVVTLPEDRLQIKVEHIDADTFGTLLG